MPRFFLRRGRKASDLRKFKVYVPTWIDPYWEIPGSSIEKMVLAELVRRGVFFIFRAQTNDLGGFVKPDWEADFLLPQHKIWIEVQGSYFHSLPGALERDSERYAAIQMAGWTPHFLWEFDIRERLHWLLDQIGVFYSVSPEVERSGFASFAVNDVYQSVRYRDSAFAVGGELVDQLVGLRKALGNRALPPQYAYKRRLRRSPR